jgi:hypothetical protein
MLPTNKGEQVEVLGARAGRHRCPTSTWRWSPKSPRTEVAPPDLTLRLPRSTGDTITVQVVEGRVPLGDELLYVGGRGAFEVARREDWGEGRVLLTLAAWPRR